MRLFLHVGGLVLDATPEQIQKVMNLYNRPGTAGEKAAAEEALRRMGVDPATFEQPRASTYSYTSPPRPRSTGSKRYRVTLKCEVGGKVMYFGPHEVEAGDQIDAEEKVRKMAKEHWRSTMGGKMPEFHASSTQRVS